MVQGRLVIISGPSAGVGKDTILKMFLKHHPDWHYPVATTTRAPRAGEVPDQDMKFVDVGTFKAWQKAGKFLETDFHAKAWYGTLREPVEQLLNRGKNVLLRIDVNGALLIKKALPASLLIFIVAESWEALEERMRKRHTEDETSIRQRLELAKSELTYQDQYDHVIVNHTGHPERAVADLEKALMLAA